MTAVRNIVPALRSATSILIATPNAILRRQLGDSLRQVTSVEDASTGAEALSMLERRGARIVVLDRRLPDLNCDELIGVVERQFPCTDVVLLNGENGEIDVPEELRGNVAYRWFQEFNFTMARPAGRTPTLPSPRPTAASVSMPLPEMIGASEAMRQLATLVRAVATHSTVVLITGETGTGKELVAEAVHKLSPRAGKPFVTVNCAAIPEALVEAELFGHTRGAFTGAVQSVKQVQDGQPGKQLHIEIHPLPILLANRSLSNGRIASALPAEKEVFAELEMKQIIGG